MNIDSYTVTPAANGPGASRLSLRLVVGAPTLTIEAYGCDVENDASPVYVQQLDLSSGNNSITIPTGAAGVIIKLPTTNTTLVTLKGVNGDTGIKLHKTAPTALIVDSTQTTFVLSAAAGITGVRLIWH